ncbi:MAG: hypothetical protein LBL79_07540 [Prevotella sp.]|nr:hypothetical protein [Prevotella sp.]
MKKDSVNYQFLYNLTDTEHYELHQFVLGVIGMCKDDIPDMASIWNIYNFLLRQENSYYKCKGNAGTPKADIPNNTETTLISYQLIYIRRKVDNVLLNLVKLINAPAETNESAPWTEEAYKVIIDLINSYLIKTEWKHTADEHLIN